MVCTVSNTLRGFLLPHASHLKSQGWRVDAAARGVTSSPECGKAFDRVWDVQWSRKPWDITGLISAYQRIRDLVQREKYDIVHVHTPIAAFVTRLALRRMRSFGSPRVVYTAHGFHFYRGGSPGKNALFLALEKLAGRWTDTLVVINEEDQQAAIQHGIVQPGKVALVPGVGIDLSLYNSGQCTLEAVQALRRELGLAASDMLFSMIAEGNPGKRHRDLVTALHLLERPNVHVAFAGTGPELVHVEEQARRLGVANRVHFLGFRSDIPVLIRASVATVLPSQREGLPRSVMESLSLERPVLGADTRGIRDLLAGGGGWLFPVGDAAALASLMAKVIDNPELAERTGKLGRESMQAYEIGTVLRHIQRLYEEVLV